MAVSGAGSSGSSSAAAAAAAAAEARRRAAEEARRRAEAARRAREEARRAAEAARRAAQAAAEKAQKAAEAAKKAKGPDRAKAVEEARRAEQAAEAAKLAQQKAEKALQDAEERVVRMAKKAEDEMQAANEASLKNGVPAGERNPFSANEIAATGLRANEVKNAFEGAGRRRDDIARAIGVDGTSTSQIQRGIEAERAFERLDDDPKMQDVLDELDIRNGSDLEALGGRLARELSGGSPRGDDLSFDNIQDKQALAELIGAAGETQADSQVRAALTNEATQALIANGADIQEAAEQGANLERAGFGPEQIADLAKSVDGDREKFQTTIDNIATLGNPDASVEDKLKAAVELGAEGTALLPQSQLQGILGKGFDGLQNVKTVYESIRTLTDPNTSGVEKAKAGLDLANTLKDVAGMSPAIAERLRGLDGPLKVAGAALTLIDPNASLKDKAIAGAEMVSALPDLKGDLTRLKDVFARGGVQNAAEVVRDGNGLARLAAEGIDPEQAARLPKDQLQQMTELARKVEGPALNNLINNVQDPKQLERLVADLNQLDATSAKNAVSSLSQVDAATLRRTLADPTLSTQMVDVASKLPAEDSARLAEALKGLDAKGTSAFLKVASNMSGDALTEVMQNADEAKNFASMVGKLSPSALEDFARAAGDMDAGAMRTIVRFGGAAPASALDELAPVLAKVASNDLIAPALSAFGKLLDVMNVNVTADIATKAVKGFAKMLPLVGAAASAYDTARFASEYANMRGKQDDLAFLAGTGMKLNALDTVLNLIPGVGDVAGIATGLGALALDIGYSAEKAKFEANPDGYQAPDWMKAVNIGAALAMGPVGVADLIQTYGAEDAAELGLWAVGKGGELAKAAWDVIKDATGPLGEVALEAVETLKNLGEAGADALKYIATSPGRLGAEVAEAAVNGLKNLGEAGVEALKEVAELGGDAAEFAVNGLKDLGEAGIGVAKDALEGLKDIGGEVGDLAEDALGFLSNLNPLKLL